MSTQRKRKERRKTVKGVWMRDDRTGQLWHFPDEYEPISGAVLNDDEGNTARQLLAMLEARERLNGWPYPPAPPLG
jgi:hypothetical protein